MKKTLYHGSGKIIEKPIFGVGKTYNDYGLGFYCTDHLEIAKEWGVSRDAISGFRADDSHFSFAQDFINGTISYRQLNNAMRLGKLGQQFVLKSEATFDRLHMGFEVAESDEWYAKKILRDKTIRREYFDVERNQRQRGDLYIAQIMDEEMRSDDPRLR